MIYWVLHKVLTEANLDSPVEGFPGYFADYFKDNFCFVDVRDMLLLSKIKRKFFDLDNYCGITTVSNKYYKINSLSSFKALLKNTNEQDIFVIQHLTEMTMPIVKYLNNKRIKVALLDYWQLSKLFDSSGERSLYSKLENFFKYSWKMKFYSLLRKLLSQKNYKKNYIDYLFVADDIVNSRTVYNIPINNLIKCNSVPLDEFISFKKTRKIDFKNYLVFVDQGISKQADTSLDMSESQKKEYDQIIIKSLKKISEETGKQIIIAEHPRVKYEDDYWGDFKHFSRITNDLISQSDGVIGHYSTSLYFAKLSRKNIIFLTYSDFAYNEHVLKMFNFLGGTLFDIDNCTRQYKGDCNYQIRENAERSKDNKNIIKNFLESYCKERSK